MASLTIRKLDDAIKAELRLRAAGNGRSVEDEVRVILREAATRAAPTAAAAPLVSRRDNRTVPQSTVPPVTDQRHADHRRRHRRL